MEQEIIKLAISQGLWAVLFVGLLFYVLKTNERREERLLNGLDELSKQYGILSETVCKIERDIEDIKRM